MPFSTSSMIFIPESLARRIFRASTAWAVAHPGRERPMASVRQAMVLAVNRPAQEPAPGHAISSRASRVSPPFCHSSKTSIRSSSLSQAKPGIIGPPVTTMVGRSSLPAAMICPGTILSQVGIITRPSSWWDSAMISMVSSISSRLGREYLIPLWPMAMPSQTPMVWNSNGTPPAERMPALTASPSRSR